MTMVLGAQALGAQVAQAVLIAVLQMVIVLSSEVVAEVEPREPAAG